MEVLVLLDFEATEADEMTVHAGDLVKNVTKTAEDGWLHGEVRGRQGIFPANFVKEVPVSLRGGDHREPRSIRKPKTVKVHTRRCEVIFPYTPMNEDELELTVGENIEILREIEDGWWLGKKNGKFGAFPSNFVKEIFVTGKEDSKAIEGKVRPKLSDALFTKEVKEPQKMASVRKKTNSVKECCQVMFDYKAVLSDELDLKKGDVVMVISKESEDEGWWEGELNGRRGFFPDNFVMVLPTISILPGAVSAPSQPETNHPPGETEVSPMEKMVQKDNTDHTAGSEGKDKPEGPSKLRSFNLKKAPPPPVKDKPSRPTPVKTDGDHSSLLSKPTEDKSKEKDADQFHLVDVSSAKLSHPTANRAKPPQRRPPTTLHSPTSPTGTPELKGGEFDVTPKKLPGLAKETQLLSAQEESCTLDEVRAAVRDLKMALDLLKTQHERDIEDLKAELKEERSKRCALQGEIQLLKKTFNHH